MAAKENHKYWPLVPEFIPVPNEFHSLEFDGPFTKCLICEADLSDVVRQYVIERIFRGTEPILEYAMCVACQNSMSSEMSEESMKSIEQFIAGVDQSERMERLQHHLDERGVTPWLDECLITGKKREDCAGYHIIAQCEGGLLQLAGTPFMLSDDAVEQLSKLLSKQTRERLDDFTGDHFGMPPEFCRQPDVFPLLL